MKLICLLPRQASGPVLCNLIALFVHCLKPALQVYTQDVYYALNDSQVGGNASPQWTGHQRVSGHLQSSLCAETNPWKLLPLGPLRNQTALKQFSNCETHKVKFITLCCILIELEGSDKIYWINVKHC